MNTKLFLIDVATTILITFVVAVTYLKPVQIKNKQVRLGAVCDRVTTLKNNNDGSRLASRTFVLIDFIYAHSSLIYTILLHTEQKKLIGKQLLI